MQRAEASHFSQFAEYLVEALPSRDGREARSYGRGKRTRPEVEYDQTKRRAKGTQKRKRDMVDAERGGAGRLAAMIAVGEKLMDKMSPMKGTGDGEDEDGRDEADELSPRTLQFQQIQLEINLH